MSDPLGLIGNGGAGGIQRPNLNPQVAKGGQDGPSFKDALLRNLDEVNKLQQEATQATEDLARGKRSDLEGVILATNKADNAFRMLQQLRNRMMEAYDEVKQTRV